MKVRRAQEADVPALVRLVNAAFLAEAPFVSGDRVDADEIRGRCASGLFLVAEDENGAFLGCVVLDTESTPGRFGLLAVSPEAQGRGLGRRLVALAEARLLAAGRTEVEIVVVSARRELLRFYETLGYAPVGTAPFPRPEKLKTPCHFVLMRRGLQPGAVRIGPGRDRGFVLTTGLLLPRPLAEVFAFFGDAANLDRITPPWLGFRILTPLPLDLREGALVDYALSLRGVPVRWRTEIVAWDPPRRFVDVQKRGPYRAWRHEHLFTASEDGTFVEDRVEYEVLGGRLVHALVVRGDLERVFRFRQERVRGLLGG